MTGGATKEGSIGSTPRNAEESGWGASRTSGRSPSSSRASRIVCWSSSGLRGRVSTTATNGSAVLTIADTGHGISSEQIAKIFDPYFTTKQGKSGTGLGLYITKKVVEDHNGSIKVDSTPQVGTSFTVRLPLQNS